MRRARGILALATALLAGAAALEGQADATPRDTVHAAGDTARAASRGRLTWFDSTRNFQVIIENDAFAGRSSDSAYTQGMRLQWNFVVRPDWPVRWLDRTALRQVLGPFAPDIKGKVSCGPRSTMAAREFRPCSMLTLALAQTMYTPADLSRSDRLTATRPYAGYLAASIANTTQYQYSMVRSEWSIGVLGPIAFAEHTQSLAHWTWANASPQPQGWKNQLRSSVHASLRNTYALSMVRTCLRGRNPVARCRGDGRDRRTFDATGNAELIGGTIMNRASAGGAVRVGWKVPEFAASELIGTTGAAASVATGSGAGEGLGAWLRQLAGTGWAYLTVGGDARFVATNAFIAGSYADRCATCWSTVRQIDIRRGVTERYAGGSGGIGRLFVAYQRVYRSAEYTPNGGGHWFSSIALGLTAPARP